MTTSHRAARRSPAPRYALLCLLAGALLSAPTSGGALQSDAGGGGSPEAGPELLTLADAIARATLHNPAFRRVTNTLQLNPLDRRERWLNILPSPQLNVLSTNLNWTRRTTAEDFFGEPLPREVVEWVQTSRSTQGFGAGFTLNLADFLQLGQQTEQAFGREVAAESGAHALRSDVSRAFLDVQERGAMLGLEEELLRAARVNRDLARESYRLGVRDRIDVVALEVDLLEQEFGLDESRVALETARLSLRSVIGDPTLETFEIVPVEFVAYEPDALDVSRLVEAARATGPSVQQALANLRMQEQDANLVRAQWLPTLSVLASGQRQDFVRGGDAFFNPNPGGGWDGTVALTVSLPDLGQYFRRSVQRQRAEVEIANGQETLRETRIQLEQNVRTLISDLRSRARNLTLQERRAGLAHERLELAREAYRLGEESYLELQSAQAQAAQAERQLLAAGFALERARIELERELGITIREMLDLSGGG